MGVSLNFNLMILIFCAAFTDQGQGSVSNCDITECYAAPCDLASCPRQPDATCRNDYCGGCFARWFLPDGAEVSEADCSTAIRESAAKKPETQEEENAHEKIETEEEENVIKKPETEEEENALMKPETEEEENAHETEGEENAPETEGEENAQEKTETEEEENALEKPETEEEENAHEKTETEGEENAHEKPETEGEENAHEKTETEEEENAPKKPEVEEEINTLRNITQSLHLLLFEPPIEGPSSTYYLSKAGTKADVNITKAEELCVAIGGQLAQINDQTTDEFIKDVLQTHLAKTSGLSGVYISGMKEEGSWVHQKDGTPVTFFEWGPGAPDNSHGNEDCIGLMRRKGSWMMNDYPCDYKRYEMLFLCEISK